MEESEWLTKNTDCCTLCGHRRIFHVRTSDGYCIVDDCDCGSIHKMSIDEHNAARLEEHKQRLRDYRIDKLHLENCSICQDELAQCDNAQLKEHYAKQGY